MCEILEGQQIEFSKESNICLNPFTNICSNDNEAIHTSISFLKSVISCMAAPTAGTTDLENALIEEAIGTVWKRRGQQATISDVASWLIMKICEPKQLAPC
jgi:conjugal transfer ATP-binding protein TraC